MGSSPSGFMFNPITNKYNIWDPYATGFVWFNANVPGNQPYACNLAKALKHLLDNGGKHKAQHYLNPQDFNYWTRFDTYYINNNNANNRNLRNTGITLRKIRALRSLP